MATLDVLAESNWENVICSKVNSWYTLNYAGWNGTYWTSEGKTSFYNCQVSEGLRITEIRVDKTMWVNPVVGWPELSPWVRVYMSNNDLIIDSPLLSGVGIESVFIPYAYTEINSIKTVTVLAERFWTSYSYGSDGDGGPTEPNFFMNIGGLLFVYEAPAEPARWRDYRKTYEAQTVA